MQLYKYSSAKWGTAILRELRFRVAPPDEFNDPFEFTPATVNPLIDLDRLKDHWDGNGLPSSKDGLSKVVAKLMEEIQIVSELPEQLQRDDMASLGEASREYGVLCLSEPKANLLMWAHYGDNHRGLAIGVDFDLHKGDSIWRFESVRYREVRAQIDPLLMIDENSSPEKMYEFDDQMLNVVLTKSTHWGYEQEHRILCKLVDLQREPRGRDGVNGVNYFLHVLPEVIREVVIGCRMSESDELLVRSICAAKCPQAQIVKLRRHPSEFALIPVEE